MNHKKLTSLIVILLLTITGYTQNWSWGLNAGGTESQYTRDIVNDGSGNQIVVGTYSHGSAVFGAYTLPWETHSTDPNNTNINSYIVKYNSSHSIVWATRITSPYDAEVSSVAADNAGNIYVCGAMSDVCHFYTAGSSSIVYTLSHGVLSGNNAFIAKYNSSGVFQWAKTGLSNATECFSEVAVNPAGTQIIVTGRINTVSPITIGTSSISTGSYVLWFNSSGTKIRGYNYSNDASYGAVYKNGLCIDNADNVIVGAKLTTSSYLVKGNSGNITVTTNANGASLFAKYSSSGNLSWAKATSGSISGSNSMPSSIIADASNDIYAGGWIQNKTSTYNFQFTAGSGYISLSIQTTIANHTYVAKLASSSGNCSWASVGHGTESGTETVFLAKGACSIIYACINTKTNPSFTDAATTTLSFSNTVKSAYILKMNTSGQFQSTSPWLVSNLYGGEGYIADNNAANVYFAGTFNSSISLQTSGSPISLSTSSYDLILSGLTDSGQLPDVHFNTITPVCLGQWLPITVTATGAAPLTFNWSIYNNSTGTFVYLGTTGSPNCTLLPSVYNPYTFSFVGYTVIYVQVAVTNCTGVTDYDYRYIAFKLPVSFSQTTDQTVCYTATDPAPAAIFSVSAQYSNTYQWKYSPDGGANWFNCGAGYSYATTSSLSVDNPIPGMNGYQYICIMTGDCSTDTSAPATLYVVNCRRETNPGNENATAFTENISVNVFPNPASTDITIEISGNSEEKGTTSVAIYDIAGKLVKNLPSAASRQQVDVSDLDAGCYFYKIIQNNTVVAQDKFIIMR